MFKYVLKRIGVGILTLFILATVTFFLMKIIPGSPFAGENTKMCIRDRPCDQLDADAAGLDEYRCFGSGSGEGRAERSEAPERSAENWRWACRSVYRQ